MILGQHSGVAQIFVNISFESNPQQNTTWPRIVYFPSHAAVAGIQMLSSESKTT